MNTQPTSDLNQMYDQLNTQLFEGKLPKIPCVWNGRLTKSLGRTKYKRKNKSAKWKVFMIDIQRGITDQHLHKTMVHEMCHVWAYHFHNEGGHGKKFWGKMCELGYPKTHCWDDALSCEKDIWS